MKTLLMFFFALISLFANGQASGYFRDTLISTGSGDDFYLYPNRSNVITSATIKGATTAALSRTFYTEDKLYIIGKVDSLSGAAAGLIIVEYGNTTDPHAWMPIDTVATINGAADQYWEYTDLNYKANKFRLHIKSSANPAQAVKNEIDWTCKN